MGIVMRFYSPWCDKSVTQLQKQAFVSSDGVIGIEICTMYGSKVTHSFSVDATTGLVHEEYARGWKPLDSENEYHIVSEARWYAEGPWGNIKLTEEMRGSPLPEELYEAIKSENVVTVALWNEQLDGFCSYHATSELKEKGFDKVYNLGKYDDDNPVDKYAYLCKCFPECIKGPKIGFIEKQRPKQPKREEKKVSGVVAGDYKLLASDIVSLIRSRYEGSDIIITKVNDDLKILIKDYQGKKTSQKK